MNHSLGRTHMNQIKISDPSPLLAQYAKYKLICITILKFGSVLVYDFWSPPPLLSFMYMIFNRYLDDLINNVFLISLYLGVG